MFISELNNNSGNVMKIPDQIKKRLKTRSVFRLIACPDALYKVLYSTIDCVVNNNTLLYEFIDFPVYEG